MEELPDIAITKALEKITIHKLFPQPKQTKTDIIIHACKW